MTLKHSVTTAILIAALALPVSAFAQTTTAPTPTTPPAAAPHAAAPAATAPTVPHATATAPASQAATAKASRHMRDDQIRASKLIGASVYDPNDQKIGAVDELVLNPDGKVADIVIGVGGFLGAGEKRVAVPMADLKRGKNDHFVLAATKDSLKQMANFELKTAGTAGSGSVNITRRPPRVTTIRSRSCSGPAPACARSRYASALTASRSTGSRRFSADRRKRSRCSSKANGLMR